MSDSVGNRKELDPQDPTPGVLSPGGGWISGASIDVPAQPVPPEPAPRPAIALAVEALRRFGGPDLSRAEAYELLQYWHRKDELTTPQVGVVLRRFRSAEPAPVEDTAAGHAEAAATKRWISPPDDEAVAE